MLMFRATNYPFDRKYLKYKRDLEIGTIDVDKA